MERALYLLITVYKGFDLCVYVVAILEKKGLQSSQSN